MYSRAHIQHRVLIAIGSGMISLALLQAAYGAPVHDVLRILQDRGLIRARAGSYLSTESGMALLARWPATYHRRSRGLRERAWWLMRQERLVTLSKLLLTLACGTERDAPGNLRSYLGALERTGVLVRMRRTTPEGEAIWRLARDLGPDAPVERRRNGEAGVYDPNSRQLLLPTQKPEASHD